MMQEHRTDEIKLFNTTDASDWVAEWMKTIAKYPEIPTDEGAMLGWFANAIMAGFDAGARYVQSATFKEQAFQASEAFWKNASAE